MIDNIRTDGEYIIKTIQAKNARPEGFDFESYKKFRSQGNDWLVEVFDYNKKTGEITMAKIEGYAIQDREHSEWRDKASYHELWDIFMTWRTSVIKTYFDFVFHKAAEYKIDCTQKNIHSSAVELQWPLIDGNTKFFFHADLTPNNVIVQDGKPIAIDPESFGWVDYSDFLLRQNFLNEKWWMSYLGYAHKRNV